MMGRLATFPSTQDAASVTAPWDPGRKSLGVDGGGRPKANACPNRPKKSRQEPDI